MANLGATNARPIRGRYRSAAEVHTRGQEGKTLQQPLRGPEAEEGRAGAEGEVPGGAAARRAPCAARRRRRRGRVLPPGGRRGRPGEERQGARAAASAAFRR